MNLTVTTLKNQILRVNIKNNMRMPVIEYTFWTWDVLKIYHFEEPNILRTNIKTIWENW